jgi:hypothetical protein
MKIATDPGIWIGALLTLGLFSWMYKENPWFRVVEHVYVAVQVGHLSIVGYQNVKDMAVLPMINKGQWILLLPLIAGLLLFSRWTKDYGYLSRVPMGYLVGTTGAVVITGSIKSNFLDQVIATMRLNPFLNVNNFIFVVCCISATIYFLFTLNQKTVAGPITSFGRYALMIAFGAAFGFTVMSRISLFTGRMQFLLGDWLGMIH